MAKGARYKVEYRRKRKRKTDYKRRLNLLKSGKPRLVIRKSNRYLLAQLIKYHPNGDKILCSANSQELKNFQWSFSLKNIPAGYLTGFLFGLRAKKKKIEEGILDLGLQRPITGSRVYSVLKGVIDAGVRIPHSPEIFPSEGRIKGEHISQHTKKEITKNFEESKKLIEKEASAKGSKKKK